MKTAEEILEKHTGHNHPLMNGAIILAMKEYATEVAKEALKNAAENAVIRGNWDYEAGEVINYIDKQSILDENNIPKI